MNNNKKKNIVDYHEDSNLHSISLKEKELPLRHGMHNYKSLISGKNKKTKNELPDENPNFSQFPPICAE